jgi:hypothetical protein
MLDLNTQAGRDELREYLHEDGVENATEMGNADLLALLDQADAGERLALACEKLIERGGAGEDEQWWKPWDDAVAEAEAAIAAFRAPPPPARAAAEDK